MELLVVVAIIAILAVAMTPAMRGLTGSQSSRATAQILVSALEQTRTAAILSGTNAYLVLPTVDTTAITNTLRYRGYAIARPRVDLNNDSVDDLQPAATNTTILVSKWERLPGDLLFSSNHLAQLPAVSLSNLPIPGSLNPPSVSQFRAIGFTRGGVLLDPLGTNGLLYGPSALTNAGATTRPAADLVVVSQYSGRVRYAGMVTNATNF